jgi:hypothetical protein
MKKKGMVREWISQCSPEEQCKLVEKLVFISYPYEKYGEVVLAVMVEHANIQILNLADKYFTDGLYIGYKETLPFVEYLGERIALSLNYFKGKSNKEIEKLAKEEESGQ